MTLLLLVLVGAVIVRDAGIERGQIREGCFRGRQRVATRVIDNRAYLRQTLDMADPGRVGRERAWLFDDRVPPRQLQVTQHSEHGVVVFSIWNENVCTASFQLQVADAPAVIDVLVAALAAGFSRQTEEPVAVLPRRNRLWAWARTKLALPA